MAEQHKIQNYRGSEAGLPTLSDGQIGWANDTDSLFIGDGSDNHQVLMHNEFGTHAVFASDDSGDAASLSISEGEVVGRSTGGTVAGLDGSDLATILSGEPADSIDMNGQKITGLADGTDAQDAATKSQVDAAQGGLDPKDSVRAATDGTNIDLTSTSDPGSIDGVSLSDGDRVLLKDQSTASENGLYKAVTAADPSTWTRTSDADEDDEVTAGMYFWVEEGSSNGDQGYVLTTDDPITVDSTDLTFTQFTGAGQITAGTNLTKDGNTLNVSPQGDGSSLDADLLDGTHLADITWSDVDMDETDVSRSDVGLGDVTNDAQIAKDGSIDFTGSQSMGDNALTHADRLEMAEITTPANPSAGYNTLFFKDDDELYALDSDGNEQKVRSDETVAVDSSATAGYIGAGSDDGVLRTGGALDYTDDGDYVTIDVGNIDCGTW